MPFIHEKLKAYRFAVEFYREVKTIRGAMPRGLASLGDQLTRAGQSIVLNLAEGAGQYARDAKRRHYRIALASANECAAALDLLTIEGAGAADTLSRARRRLDVTIALTVGLAR